MSLLESVAPGSAVAPPEHVQWFFDRLSAASVMLASGIRQIRTSQHQLAVPVLVDDVAAGWTAEGAEITLSDPDLAVVTATPRKLGALTLMSNEIVDDSIPAILELVGDSITRSLGLKLDLGMLEGSGTAPEIRGLRNQSGIQTVSMGTNGAALTNLDPFAEAIGQLDGANAGAMRAIVMSPRNWTALSKIKEATGSNKPVLTSDVDPAGAIRRAIYGVPVFLTSQLSTTETQGSASTANSIYVYDTQQVVSVMRKDISIVTSSDWKFSADQTAVRGIVRADLVLPNPEAVVRIAGVLPAA